MDDSDDEDILNYPPENAQKSQQTLQLGPISSGIEVVENAIGSLFSWVWPGAKESSTETPLEFRVIKTNWYCRCKYF